MSIASDDPASKKAADSGLTPEELKQVEELKNRDREVRNHEQAHKAVGGRYSGGVSFSFQTGPDGKRYATGGEVGINVSEGNTPEGTIQKAVTIRAAALAPAEPSSQDRKVAAEASQMAETARQELRSEKQTQTPESNEEKNVPNVVTADRIPTRGLDEASDPVIFEKAENSPSGNFNKAGNAFQQREAAVKKAYQVNLPVSFSPESAAAAGMAMLSMTI